MMAGILSGGGERSGLHPEVSDAASRLLDHRAEACLAALYETLMTMFDK